MRIIKKAMFNFMKKTLPDMWFHKLLIFYMKHNSKYDEGRFLYEYRLSSRRSKKKYFVFRYAIPGMGIGAVCRNIIPVCEWAEKNKMIPIIDLEWLDVYEDGLLGIDNVWEYVFDQRVSIKQVIKKDNVFVGGLGSLDYSIPLNIKGIDISEPPLKFVDKNWKMYYRELNYYGTKWWRLKPSVLERYTLTFSKLFHPDMKILGVALREEFSLTEKDIDLKGSRLSLHPHHMALDNMQVLIRKFKQKWGCTHVFVSTMMADSVRKLQAEFGEEILFTNRMRVEFEKYKKFRKNPNLQEKDIRKMHDWIKSSENLEGYVNGWDKELTIEYMEEVYGLSLCDCLVSYKSGGAFIACVWNGGKYEELEILTDENESTYY